MPAYLTHRAAGERVLERLTKEAVPHKLAFFLGCQGPDLLYFNWWSMLLKLPLGMAMHFKKTKELILHAFEYIKNYDKKDKGELFSYLAGFMTHYAVDKYAHPFIYDKAGGSKGLHHATEYMWDSYMSKEQWDIEPYQFDVFSEVMYGDIGEGISSWYTCAARDVYGKKFRETAARRAQNRLAKVKRTLSDPPFVSRVLLRMVSRFMGFKARTALYPEQRDESLFTTEEYSYMKNIISKGVDEACDSIRFMLGYINGADMQMPEWLGDKNFAGESLGA